MEIDVHLNHLSFLLSARVACSITEYRHAVKAFSVFSFPPCFAAFCFHLPAFFMLLQKLLVSLWYLMWQARSAAFPGDREKALLGASWSCWFLLCLGCIAPCLINASRSVLLAGWWINRRKWVLIFLPSVSWFHGHCMKRMSDAAPDLPCDSGCFEPCAVVLSILRIYISDSYVGPLRAVCWLITCSAWWLISSWLWWSSEVTDFLSSSDGRMSDVFKLSFSFWSGVHVSAQSNSQGFSILQVDDALNPGSHSPDLYPSATQNLA